MLSIVGCILRTAGQSQHDPWPQLLRDLCAVMMIGGQIEGGTVIFLA